jgi:Tfp pilus assembly ATPase PilU
MQTLNDSLYSLYMRDEVTLEECVRISSDPLELKRMVGEVDSPVAVAR